MNDEEKPIASLSRLEHANLSKNQTANALVVLFRLRGLGIEGDRIPSETHANNRDRIMVSIAIAAGTTKTVEGSGF